MTRRSRETEGVVADAVRKLYAALGDPDRFDAHLHPDVTIWESDQPGGRIGLAELTRLRERRRPEQGAQLPELHVDDLLVDRWGEAVAVARYVLNADGGGRRQSFRVTDVWEAADGGRWQIVHHHAEQLAEAGGSAQHHE